MSSPDGYSGSPLIAGQGVPQALLQLYLVDGEALIGEVIVDTEGMWQIIPPTPLTNGMQAVVARQIVSEIESDFSEQVSFLVTEGATPGDPGPGDPGPGDPGPGDPGPGDPPIGPPLPEEPIWPGSPF